MASNTVQVNIIGDASKLKKELKDSETALGGFQSKLKGMATSLAAVAGGIGVASFFKGAVSEAQEAQKVAAQTEAVLKSTGNAANVTAEEIGNLATKLSEKSGIDHEVIQSGENMIATFTNIRNEVGKGNDIFDQATTVILDMSVALGQDMSSSAIQVGKALNDPIKGISALTRVGVTFTQGQKDQIAAMVENNDIMGAQKVILAELTKEFGGSAEAQATSLGKASVAFKNLQETIGTALAPAITLAAEALGFLSTGIGDVTVLAGLAGIAVAGLVVHYGKLVGANIIAGIQGIIKGFAGIRAVITSVVIPSVIAAADAFFALTLAEQAAITAGIALAAIGIGLVIRELIGGKSAAEEFAGSAHKLVAEWTDAGQKAGGFEGALARISGELDANKNRMAGLRTALSETTKTYRDQTTGVLIITDRYAFLSQKLQEGKILQGELRAEWDRLNAKHQEVVKSAEAVATKFGVDIPASLQLSTKELKQLEKDLPSMVAAFGTWSTTALLNVGIVGDSFKALMKTADDFSGAMQSSIKSATDPFAHFGDQAEFAAGEFEKFFVTSQLAAGDWADTITGLIKRGVDAGIVQEIAQAGVKAKPALDEFVKLVDEKGVEWVNSVSSRGKEAAEATDDAFRLMVVATAIRLAEQKIIVEAVTKDIEEGGTKNLAALAKNSDEKLRGMAYDALLRLGEIRTTVETPFPPITVTVDYSDLDGLLIKIGEIRAAVGAAGGNPNDALTGGGFGSPSVPDLGPGWNDFINGRASGGPVGPGTWMVGERGPELLTLGSGASGYVTSNAKMRSDAGGTSVVVNVERMYGSPEENGFEISRRLRSEAFLMGR